MAAMDPAVFPLIVGMFAGPESIPADLVEAGERRAEIGFHAVSLG